VAGILLNRVDWKGSRRGVLVWLATAGVEWLYGIRGGVGSGDRRAFPVRVFCRPISEAQIGCRTIGFIRAAIEDLNWSRWVAGSAGWPLLGSTTDV
jgi:hypothetical protein